jgi:hypothetical protein
MKTLSQDTRRIGQDLKWAPPEYMSKALPLQQTRLIPPALLIYVVLEPHQHTG